MKVLASITLVGLYVALVFVSTFAVKQSLKLQQSNQLNDALLNELEATYRTVEGKVNTAYTCKLKASN